VEFSLQGISSHFFCGNEKIGQYQLERDLDAANLWPALEHGCRKQSRRSSMAAESKRRALAFYFSMRTWYMFPMSKCRGESD